MSIPVTSPAPASLFSSLPFLRVSVVNLFRLTIFRSLSLLLTTSKQYT
ncbi:MAG: hypothetical protein AVDCRST_MAG56-5822 [uncultured Cytophagales bacterium]|uniref:Uncharacterized protein n=1 Tax=uncultured Cytophagales bacterium TaxID=158755 RepID=A0A6J4K2W1_9SPHI|nr:MAG: hypothetical protein AVDCRST_MAG56-5822 [uncultured Cytophagales bacterium]